MLHFLLGVIFATVLISNAWSACAEESSCYHQVTKLSIIAESVKAHEVDFEINPLNAQFENVPEPKIYNYVLLEREDEGADSIKINIVSYICSGETPLGADALSNSLKRLAENKTKDEADPTIFVSTGRPEDNISVSLELKTKAKVYDRFIELFEERTFSDITEDISSNIYVPNVISGLSSSAEDRKLYSSFLTRTSSSINGCSQKFLKTMKDLLIENVQYPNIIVQKKLFTDKYRLHWNF